MGYQNITLTKLFGLLAASFLISLKAAAFSLIPDWEYKDEPTVFGLTQTNAAAYDGDIRDTACNKRHLQGDMSNRWCHAFLVSLNKPVIGSIMALKEFFWDKNPSASGFVIPDISLYKRLNVSVFGDGLVVFSFSDRF
jgi:hypothetical protein